jgi:hypothetical protein
MNVRPNLVEHPQSERSVEIPGRSGAGERLISNLYRTAVALFLLVILFRIVWHFSGRSILDDAFMFVRYADHVIRHGTLSWNYPGPPTFGLTAVAYVGIVILMRLFFPDSPGAVVVLSSMLSGLLFLGLLTVLIRRYSGATPRTRRIVTLFALGSIAAGSYSLTMHFCSGMDTMFDLSMLTALIIGHKRNEQRPARWLTLLLGVATGAIFFVRPDLLIYALGIPGIALLTARDRATQLRNATIIAIGVAVLGLDLLATTAYFGIPLPLPFYAKALRSYTGYIVEFYRYAGYKWGLYYLAQYWPISLVALPSFFGLLRLRGLRVFTPVELGLWASTMVFIIYYLFFVLQIMPQEARFYYPTLPALLLLGTRSIVLLWEVGAAPARWAADVRTWIAGLAGRRRTSLAGAVGALVLVSAVVLYARSNEVSELARLIGVFDARYYYTHTLTYYWYRLDEIAELPDDLVMGTTEVGMPAALCPGKRIIDIAGLNDAEIVRHGFSTDILFTRYSPDVFYMPHPHYTDMNRAILSDPRFARRYELFTAEQLGTEMGMAIRRDSRYYPQLRAIALEGPRKD